MDRSFDMMKSMCAFAQGSLFVSWLGKSNTRSSESMMMTVSKSIVD